MSDDDSSEESEIRQELEQQARVADTPNEDPRGQTAEVAQAKAAENDTDE